MNTSFKVIILSILVLFLLFPILGNSIDEDKKNIYDNNTRILEEGDSYYFYQREIKIYEDYINIKYNKFYGLQTIWIIEIEDPEEIKFSFDSIVNIGSFKVVVITPENKLINLVEGCNNGNYKINAVKGKYKVKIVGKNGKGIIRLNLN